MHYTLYTHSTGQMLLFVFFSAASVDILISNVRAFLDRFSIRRLKMGEIIQFLKDLELEDTKTKMATLIKTIKVRHSSQY